jgi:hypothetical protein
MFATKIQIEERKSQMPRSRSYPATVYVSFDNADGEAHGVPNAIELSIENKNGVVGCLLYVSQVGFGSDEQAAVFVRELQQLDAIAEAEGKRDAVS